MGLLLIRCPKTGRAISTGRNATAAALRCSPVFFSQTYCALCHETHQWFATEAWVKDSESSEQEDVRKERVA